MTTYNITPNTTSISEGGTVTFEINFQGDSPNKPLLWKNIGTALDDLVEGNTGYTPIVSGTSTFFSITLKTDIFFDINEDILITLEDPDLPNTILTSTTITIIDNSPIVISTPSQFIINEGNSVSINILTENISNGTILNWKNVGNTDIKDFSNNKNQGSITINNNSATLILTLLADKKLEGDEYIVLQFLTTTGELARITRTIEVIDTSIPEEQNVINLTEIKDLTTIIENNISIWKTNENLGVINTNEASELKLETTTIQPFNLYYKIKEGNLPPGLTLQNDGTIIGNPIYNISYANTSTDYIFTVTISKITGNPISTSTFFLTHISNTSTQYTEVYLKPSHSINQRKQIKEFLNNKNIFKKEYIYRPFDQNFGVSKDFRFVLHYGIEMVPIENLNPGNFYKRRFSLSNVTFALAKDPNGDILYEVIYSPIIDYNINRNTQESIPRVIDNLYWYPSSIINMRKTLELSLKHTDELNPRFMKTIQTGSFQELGYIPCVIYCYAKPGKSKFIIDLIKKANINFNKFDFEIDKLWVRNFNGEADYMNRFDDTPTYS